MALKWGCGAKWAMRELGWDVELSSGCGAKLGDVELSKS